MLSKIKDLIKAELSDPSVQRGVVVALSMVALKYGLDQAHADDLSTGVWSAITILISRMPGKAQP